MSGDIVQILLRGTSGKKRDIDILYLYIYYILYKVRSFGPLMMVPNVPTKIHLKKRGSLISQKGTTPLEPFQASREKCHSVTILSSEGETLPTSRGCRSRRTDADERHVKPPLLVTNCHHVWLEDFKKTFIRYGKSVDIREAP